MENDERKRAEQMILKVGTEQILCDALADPLFLEKKGYDIVAHLMSLDSHDFNKHVGKVLNEFDRQFSVERPDNWRMFTKRVEEACFKGEDGSYKEFHNLSSKAQYLRRAAVAIATLADAFEYIEKAELNNEKEIVE